MPFSDLDPEYLNLCLNTNYAREFCRQVKTDGVSQSNINAQKLGSFEVPFCPLAEQQEIVRRVEKMFALIGKIETAYKDAHRRLDHLSRSVLSKAFHGELVPTATELGEADSRSAGSVEQQLERIDGPNQSGKASKQGRRSGRAKRAVA